MGHQPPDLEARLETERHRTEALIEDLKQELAAIAESTAAGPDDEHDSEGSTVAYERARVQALLARAEHTAEEIAAATERAAQASAAGDATARCQQCHLPIPAERLIALPTARTCVSCAAAGRPGTALG